MARNPARPDHVGHVIRTDEEIRQLRIRSNLDKNPNIVDLADYLYVYDPTPGASYEGWAPYTDGSTAFAGFHVVGGRCFLTGMIQWLGGTSDNGSRGAHGNLAINATALPAPNTQVVITIPMPAHSNSWLPAPLGGADAYPGAAIEIVVTTTGYLEQDTTFANYKGAAKKASSSTNYTEAVPDGGVLSLEGLSWAVAASD